MDSLNKILNIIIEINSIDTVKIMLVGQTGWLGMNVCDKKSRMSRRLSAGVFLSLFLYF